MPAPNEFLNQPDAELEEFLIRLARNERVPEAARRRALLGVASASAGTGLLTKLALVHSSPSSLAKSTGWLVAKWLTLGAGAGVLTLSAAQGIERLALAPPATESAQMHSAATAKPVRRRIAAREVEPPIPAQEPPPIEPAGPAASSPPPSLTPVSSAAQITAPSNGSGAVSTPNAASSPSAASTPSAASMLDSNSLSDELALLERVRTELAHHHGAQAQSTLDEYEARFSHGALQVEAAALRIEALGQMGNRELAQRLAESFLIDHATSPLAARVRAFIPASPAREPAR